MSLRTEISAGPSLKRRLLSGSAWAFGGKGLAVLAGLVSNALLARLLPPQDLGAYFLAFSVVSLGAIAGSLGLNKSVVRFIAESVGLSQYDRARRAVGLTLTLGAVGATGVGVAYLFLGGLVGEGLFHTPALVAVTGLVAGWMVVATLQSLLTEVFRGFHDIRFATLFGGMTTGGGLLSTAVLAASLALLWWQRGEASLATILLLAIVSGSVSTLFAGWLLHRKVADLPPESSSSHIGVKEMLGVSGSLLVTHLMLFVLMQAGLWILGIFRPSEEVALFGTATRMVALVSMPLLIINLVVPPLMAEMYAQDRRAELERTVRAAATVAGIPSFLVLGYFIVAGESILGLTFGDYYREAALALALLSVGKLVNVWAGSCGIALQMTGNQQTMMWITVSSGLVLVAGTLGAVGNYGINGVAAVSAFSLALQNVLMVIFARKKVGIWTHVTVPVTPIRKMIYQLTGAER